MKTLLLRIVLCYLFILFWSVAALARRDKIIRLEGKTLVGLPKEYNPAELDLKNFQIRIKDHTMEFSPFLRSLFPTEQRFDLMITASWYHTWSSLPPYIVLHIDPKGKDFSYEILLNLDTLDVIRVSVVLKEFDSTTRYVPVELSESQKQDIKKSIKYIE